MWLAIFLVGCEVKVFFIYLQPLLGNNGRLWSMKMRFLPQIAVLTLILQADAKPDTCKDSMMSSEASLVLNVNIKY